MTLKYDVLACSVRNCQRGDVGYSLCLMDDSVCKRQVLSVLNLHLATSNHIPQLVLDLIWKKKANKRQRSNNCFLNLQKPENLLLLLKDKNSTPCIFGYLAINRNAHLSVDDVVSVPAVNRFMTVASRLSLW